MLFLVYQGEWEISHFPHLAKPSWILFPLNSPQGQEAVEGDARFPPSSWWGVKLEISALLEFTCPYLTASLLTGTSDPVREKKQEYDWIYLAGPDIPTPFESDPAAAKAIK